MIITLHQIDPERNRQRFYTLQLAPNLFGEWSLIRSWGRIGTSGQQRTSWHDSPEAAEPPSSAPWRKNSAAATASPRTLRPRPAPRPRNTTAPADAETLRRRLEGIPGSLWETPPKTGRLSLRMGSWPSAWPRLWPRPPD